jgi:anti-sigma regulatory factor (Ser/Thr protein kinase)/anti-anti-sigma regulatory factor
MSLPVKTASRASVVLPALLETVAGRNFEAEVAKVLTADTGELLVDCSELNQVYSGHIRLMWVAREMCRERGVALRLTSVRPDIVRILRLLDLTEFFPFEIGDGNCSYADAIPMSGESVREALRRFDDFLKQQSVPDTIVTDVRTICYEITTNIAQHGGLDSSEVVVMTAVLTESTKDREMTLHFMDSGRPFDPTEPRPLLTTQDAADSRRTRGYGLVMVARLADRVAYERFREAHNLLTVSKRWSK